METPGEFPRLRAPLGEFQFPFDGTLLLLQMFDVHLMHMQQDQGIKIKCRGHCHVNAFVDYLTV